MLRLSIFYLMLIGELLLPASRGLIVETYRRGALFDVVTFSKELYFYSSERNDRCFAATMLAESYARAKMIDESELWMKRMRENCNPSFSRVGEIYFKILMNDTEKPLQFAEITRLIQDREVACRLKLAYLSKTLRLKELKSELKKCSGIIDKYRKKQIQSLITSLKLKGRFLSEIPRIAVVPGSGEILLGKRKEGLGAIFMVGGSSIGLINSFVKDGFYEFWLFPLVSYYIGSIAHTYKLTLKEYRREYSTFTNKINNILLTGEFFLRLLSLENVMDSPRSSQYNLREGK